MSENIDVFSAYFFAPYLYEMHVEALRLSDSNVEFRTFINLSTEEKKYFYYLSEQLIDNLSLGNDEEVYLKCF